jgi:lysophospholipase L1-like esterase
MSGVRVRANRLGWLAAVLLVALTVVAGRARDGLTAPPTRIMPLGDSITEGRGATEDPSGYRGRLWSRLKADGLEVDFVGTLKTGPAGVDADHEGHPGWRIDQLTAELAGWLAKAQPDLILLHIGRNDIGQGASVPEVLARTEALLDVVATRRPEASVLVASIVGVSTADGQNEVVTRQYNAELERMVGTRAAAGQQVVFVDVYGETALQGADFSDYYHPNDQGYGKMAEVWYRALAPRLRSAK